MVGGLRGPGGGITINVLSRFLVNSLFYALDAAKAFSRGRQRVAVISGHALVSVVSQTTLIRLVVACRL
jgi:hypothetical protein